MTSTNPPDETVETFSALADAAAPWLIAWAALYVASLGVEWFIDWRSRKARKRMDDVQ